ncbi:MAG: hypothetical protein IPI35_30075 [Deltaproteobacteria bacterium]|nr:hypothetical protein [Deltaproteobacteria bacterium]
MGLVEAGCRTLSEMCTFEEAGIDDADDPREGADAPALHRVRDVDPHRRLPRARPTQRDRVATRHDDGDRRRAGSSRLPGRDHGARISLARRADRG